MPQSGRNWMPDWNIFTQNLERFFLKDCQGLVRLMDGQGVFACIESCWRNLEGCNGLSAQPQHPSFNSSLADYFRKFNLGNWEPVISQMQILRFVNHKSLLNLSSEISYSSHSRLNHLRYIMSKPSSLWRDLLSSSVHCSKLWFTSEAKILGKSSL